MEPQQTTLESLLRELLRQVIREEINQALAQHLPALTAQQQTTPEIMDITGAANFLGLSKGRMYKMTSGRVIPYYTTGKRVYFKRSELIDYVTKIRIKPNYEIEQDAASYIVRNRRRY